LAVPPRLSPRHGIVDALALLLGPVQAPGAAWALAATPPIPAATASDRRGASTGGAPAAAPDDGLSLIEAVEMALAHDPNVALAESRLAASQGTLLVASGRFDPLLVNAVSASESAAPAAAGEATETREVNATLGLTALLRSGLLLTPEVRLDRSADGSPAANTANVSFTLRQPLLRGRGSEVVAAAERAAGHQVAASRLDLRHTVSLRLRAVVFQYWATVAAAADLEVLRTTEASSRDLLASTRRLIEADVIPAAEIVQLEADVAASEASRIVGEQALFAARQDLGREIGLDPGQIRALLLPGDPLPELAPDAVPREREEEFGRQALARRADLGAAVERLAASEALLAEAENAVRPRLDLVLTPSYASLVEGDGAGDFFAPLVRDVPGLSTELGLSLLWPIGNRAARGALIESGEARRQSALVVELTAKEIGAEVPVALDAVWRSAQLLEKAVAAVVLFERTLQNEEKKLRAGSSTLIDVINQRDRLTAARRNRVSAQLALALALAELRFQTGTLVGGAGELGTVSDLDFTTVPSLEAP
jgi:outer membrane protein TolC